MSLRKTLIIIAIGWLVFITLLHETLNLHLFSSKHTSAGDEKKFRIGFLPVTCHLTCPVTDFINKQITGDSFFEPLRFNGWPELKEAYLSGYTRVLWLTKDVWPNFISCVLAVHEDMIKNHRDVVQQLVDGIAKSGKWIDKSMDHRMEAAQFVANNYYNQNPRLLSFVLSKPPDRVKYTNLTLRKPDFEEIEELGREAGILKGTAHFEDYTDASFVTDESAVQPYDWEPSKKP